MGLDKGVSLRQDVLLDNVFEVLRLRKTFISIAFLLLGCAREKDVPLVIHDEPLPMLSEIALESSETLVQGLSFPKDAHKVVMSMTWQVRQSATGIPSSGIKVTESITLIRKECDSQCFTTDYVDVQTSPPVEEIEQEVRTNMEKAYLEVRENGLGSRTNGPKEFQDALVKLIPFLQDKVLWVGARIPFAHTEQRLINEGLTVVLTNNGEYTFAGRGKIQGKEQDFFVLSLQYNIEGASNGEKVASGVGKGVFLFDCNEKGLRIAEVKEQVLFLMTLGKNKQKAKKLKQLQTGTLKLVIQE